MTGDVSPELRAARVEIDRLKVERAELLERISTHEQEIAAQRDFHLSKNGAGK